MWEKRTLWENSARVPLIIRAPWIAGASSGQQTNALVELVDVYKTVCELAGVPLPGGDTHPVEGKSCFFFIIIVALPPTPMTSQPPNFLIAARASAKLCGNQHPLSALSNLQDCNLGFAIFAPLCPC